MSTATLHLHFKMFIFKINSAPAAGQQLARYHHSGLRTGQFSVGVKHSAGQFISTFPELTGPAFQADTEPSTN